MLRLCSIALVKNALNRPLSRMEAHRWLLPSRSLSSTSPRKDMELRDDDGNGCGEIVRFLTLNNLRDNPGAVKKKRRVGRGTGCSKGKTCGRGHKGQKSRSGGTPAPFFEGGQTPFHKRIPKRGFTNKRHAQPMVPINVGTLQDYVDMGRLILPPSSQNGDYDDDSKSLDIKDLVRAGMITESRIKHGVKLLGDGAMRVRSKFRIEVSRASKSAIRAVEAAGGEVTTVHYNRLALRALLKPHKFELLPRRAAPPPKLMAYYTSFEKRGYLAPEVQKRKLMRRLRKEKEKEKEEEGKKEKVEEE